MVEGSSEEVGGVGENSGLKVGGTDFRERGRVGFVSIRGGRSKGWGCLGGGCF